MNDDERRRLAMAATQTGLSARRKAVAATAAAAAATDPVERETWLRAALQYATNAENAFAMAQNLLSQID